MTTRWTRLLAPAVAAALWGAALSLVADPMGAATPAQTRAPAGTLIDHPCTNCAYDVAATDDAVWLGTLNAGVVRWDRASGTMERFTRADGLGGDTAGMLAAAADGRVWAAVRDDRSVGRVRYDGLSRYDGAGWTHFPAAGFPITVTPISMVADPAAGVWISGGGATARFDGAGWAMTPAADGLPLAGHLARDVRGGMWLASGSWVYELVAGAWVTRHTFAAVAPDGEASRLAVASDGTLCVALANRDTFVSLGIACFDGSAWRRFTVADGMGADAVADLAIDASGTVWAAHAGYLEQSLSAFDGVRWRSFSTADTPGLPGDWVGAVDVAPDGTLVATGLSGGVGVRTEAGWTTLRDASHPAAHAPFALAEAPDGALWTGFALSRGAHVVQRRIGDRWETWTMGDGMVPLEEGPLGAQVGALAVAPDGTPWLGTWGDGLLTRDASGWRTIAEADGLPSNRVRDVVVAPDGRLWAATFAGIARRDAPGWTIYHTSDGLPSDDVRALAAAPDGTIWAATPSGAARWDGARWATVTRADGLPSDEVHNVAVGSDGAVWFATFGGLARLKDGGWRTWTTADGLPGDLFAYGLGVDATGRAWAGAMRDWGTFAGLVAVDDAGWRILTEADGLYGDAVFDVEVTRDGHVWIASLDGLQEFVPEPLVPWPAPSPTAAPTPLAAPSCTCPAARRALPAAVLADALANPALFAGWGQRVNPSLPPSPANPLRACLDIQNPGTPYNPTFNGPLWRGSCR